MTCREKLKLEHPECINDSVNSEGEPEGCPDHYDYLPMPKYCGDPIVKDRCTKCWNREIPEEDSTEVDAKALQKIGEYLVEGLTEGVKNDSPKVTEVAERIANSILDSGDRTEFESGAVRDMHEGKGRCDLMPLNVVAQVLHDDYFIEAIHRFQTYGDVFHLVEMLRQQVVFTDDCTMFLEVAKHFEDGCKKYGENNWRKGIPCKVYIDSAVRHYLKYLRGDTDERHDRAFIWNIMCCIWTYENKPELRGDIGGKSV